MNNIHGVIACAGNGSRFAESVGKPFPYPKHLEDIGGKTILHRSLEALTHNIGVNSVTFTLNPLLQEEYVAYLHKLQANFPDTPFTYAPAIEIEGGRLFTNIQATLTNGAHQLDGQKVYFDDPIVAIGLGDSVITKGNKETLNADMEAALPHITDGKSLAIYRDIELKGLMYWISRVSELGEGEPDFRREASDYGLRWWNCNTKEELLTAERELGYSPKENGLMQSFNPRKEMF